VQQRAAGVDDRPVVPDRDEKQISAEETFDVDIADHAKLRTEIARLADKTGARLRSRQLLAGCVTVKIRRKDFTTFSRQRRIEPPTQETRVIASVATALLDAWLATQPHAALRLIGVGVSDLAERRQADLFEAPESTRNRQLDAALDGIRARFGRAALARASSLESPAARPAQEQEPRARKPVR
jgi:DNA polymerase-4